jgi:23S rRNA (adenine2030-N6)-methyltransferase
MNYRHAYHAGNHTEVFKHAALVLILEHLLKKPQPFMVLDTHGGLGIYDLNSEEAAKTSERSNGVDKVFSATIPCAAGYIDILRQVNGSNLTTYPGSPEIVRRMLRANDRLVVCELHPEDFKVVSDRYRSERRMQVQHRDGYGAIKALLPPPERRGLVFIDPPFEDRDEVDQMTKAVETGLGKWATGIYCLWYPVKDSKIGDILAASAQTPAHPKTLRVEFLPLKADGNILAGSGLLICNTPWNLDEKLRLLCRDLSSVLGNSDSTWSVDWITNPT